MSNIHESIEIILVDKIASLKKYKIKEFSIEHLYKKCGFKNDNHFEVVCEWRVKINNIATIRVYGKIKGKVNYENKYEFPHPFNTLLFGTAVLVGFNESNHPCSISLDEWNNAIIIINKGIFDLAKTKEEDDNEIDELEIIPDKYKTKQGYLKDGFVVDSESDTEHSPDDVWVDVGDEDPDADTDADDDIDINNILQKLQEEEIQEEQYQY